MSNFVCLNFKISLFAIVESWKPRVSFLYCSVQGLLCYHNTLTPKPQWQNKNAHYLLTRRTYKSSITNNHSQTQSDSLASRHVVSSVTTGGKKELEVHALTFKCFHLEMTHVTSIYTLRSGNHQYCQLSSWGLGNDESKGV